jgi:dolichyl-phosphate beta-glucosyltransferase
MSRPFLSVVIPAYNEANRIPLTLVDVDRHLHEQEFTSEIVVVVSQGTDNTPEILKRFQAVIKNLRVINLSENRGRGHAIKTGMLAAKGTWRLTMDADNSATLTECSKMLPFVTEKNNNCEIVIGSRYIEGAHVDPPMPSGRRSRERFFHFFTSIFLVRGIQDTTCGFKLFSSSSAERIFTICRSNAWAIDTECLAVAQHLKYNLKEVPVSWAYDPGTHRKGRSWFNNFKEHLVIAGNLIGGRYK